MNWHQVCSKRQIFHLQQQHPQLISNQQILIHVSIRQMTTTAAAAASTATGDTHTHTHTSV